MSTPVIIQYQRLTRVAFSNTSPNDLLAGTQGTDYLGSATFPGGSTNILKAQTLIRLSLWSNLITAASSPGNLQIQLKFANSVVADTGNLALASSLTAEWELSYLLTMRDGGVFVCNGMFRVPKWPPDSQVAIFSSGNANQTFSIGFTGDNTLQVFGTFDTAGNTIGLEQGLIEFFPRYTTPS